MMQYSTEPRTRKYVKGYGFLSFARIFSNKYKKKSLDTRTNASNKVIHKVAKATG